MTFYRPFHLLCCVLASSFSVSPVNALTHVVSNDTELMGALQIAVDGDTIKLSSGEYGPIVLESKRFNQFLTITSANKNNLAKVSNIEIADSSFIKIDNLEVEGSGSQVVSIRLGSTDIEVINSEIHGQLLDRDQPNVDDFSASFGIRVLDNSARISLINNNIHDVQNATAVFGGSDIVLSGNYCDWVLSDCYKFGGVDTLLFENNFGARNIVPEPTSHVDFMQAQGSVKNGVFRGNVAIMGNESFQGLFFGGNDSEDAHTNNLIENNLIYMQNGNGITFNEYSSGNTVRFNTVLHSPKDLVRNVSVGGDIKEFNVIISRLSRSRIEDTNHYIQYEDSTRLLHYDHYYKNLAKDSSLISIEDFRPVENSPAVDQAGAFKRIFELLGKPQSRNTNFLPAINLLIN